MNGFEYLDYVYRELDKVLCELRRIEPYWDKCFPCANEGRCCEGAPIGASYNEWHRIKEYVEKLDEDQKAELRTLIIEKKMCVFLGKSCCLIHDVRPFNCRFVPYQAYLDLWDNRNLTYYEYTETCAENRRTIPHTLAKATMTDNHLILIENIGRWHFHLPTFLQEHKIDFDAVKIEDELDQLLICAR